MVFPRVHVPCRGAGGVTSFYGHGQVDALAAIKAGPQVRPDCWQHTKRAAQLMLQ